MTGQPPQGTLTYSDAERLYGEIMSALSEIIRELGSSIDDPRIADNYRAIEMQLQDIYSYTKPPLR